ncbi:MAG: DUF389 domain-containing protein [Pirellulaceae bacterium]
MAVAILVSSPAEAERCTAIGLDFAARLDQPLAVLCLQPDPSEASRKTEEGGKDKSKAEPDSDPPTDDDEFTATTSYADETREIVQRHIATMNYGFVLNDVLEVPCKIDDLRGWLMGYHEAPHLGNFHIETLLLPIIRGAGTEQNKGAKDRLFETAQCETVYVCVDNDQTGRLPLDHIGVIGQGHTELLVAMRFASRLTRLPVTKVDATERDEEQQAIVVGIRGRAGQTRVDNNQWNKCRRDTTLPVAMMVNPPDSSWERFGSWFDEKLRKTFHAYQMSREKRIELSNKLENGAKSSTDFILFMSLATFLACIGLIQDSAAVIIGAMLVAPLMTPLLGAGLSMIYGNKPLFWQAIRSITLGVGIAFLIGTFLGLITLILQESLVAIPHLVLTNEMIARSQPNMLDPFVGLAAGLAGGFAIGRDGQIGTVAGVAIAAALVPPIATAGLETAIAIYAAVLHGDISVFFRLIIEDPKDILKPMGLMADDAASTESVHLIIAPVLLFVLNACATIIGAFFGLRMVGMHRTKRPRNSRSWVTVVFMLLLFAMVIFLMVLPAMDLGFR